MAGYSATPLRKKLGIKGTSVVFAINPPADYTEILGPLPEGARFEPSLSPATDIVHVFTTRRADLEEKLTMLREHMPESTALWVSWPKKAAALPTDLSEDAIRDAALPLGFVDVKVCAVTEVWSGLKLVVRRELRSKPPAEVVATEIAEAKKKALVTGPAKKGAAKSAAKKAGAANKAGAAKRASAGKRAGAGKRTSAGKR